MRLNPYVIGQWVRGEKFYGRASQIEEVLHGHRSWLWLLGTRRIGKTSLLKQLEFLTSQSDDSGFFPIFWDFQGSDSAEELHQNFCDALLDAEDRLESLQIDPEKIQGSDLFDSVGRLRRKLRQCNRKVMLLCDEAEELIKFNTKDPGFLRKLRRMLQSQEDIHSVLASTIRLWALAGQSGDTSPFLHGFAPPIFIRGMSDGEARALIRQENLDPTSRSTWADEAVEEIRRKCDNHPYLIQLVCKRFLELGDLKDAMEEVASDQMVSYFFSVDFEMLSPTERDVIRVIAETSSANSESIRSQIWQGTGELAGILQRLEQLGYIRRNEERRFELVNDFFRRWFLTRPDSRIPRAGSGSPAPPGLAPSDQSTQFPDLRSQSFDDRYKLLEILGKGATGLVYKAHDPILRETIAIKILKPEFSSDPEVLERFRQEILLARDIGHPNIIKVYHLGECQGCRYLAMKWIQGSTLAQVIADQGPLPLERTVDIAWKLASALEAAHGRQVIHRDIKPLNIMVDEEGEPFLTDFGLARLLSGPGITRAGIFMGTPDYASPEQARLLPPDERSDIYSLGVVLFEMATGKKPFAGDSTKSILEMHRTSPAQDPRRLRPEIPSSLAHIVLRCLEKEPERRFADARSLRTALDSLRNSP